MVSGIFPGNLLFSVKLAEDVFVFLCEDHVVLRVVADDAFKDVTITTHLPRVIEYSRVSRGEVFHTILQLELELRVLRQQRHQFELSDQLCRVLLHQLD